MAFRKSSLYMTPIKQHNYRTLFSKHALNEWKETIKSFYKISISMKAFKMYINQRVMVYTKILSQTGVLEQMSI